MNSNYREDGYEHKCPYCDSNNLSLKENYWTYYRYHCCDCHKYFAVQNEKIIKISE